MARGISYPERRAFAMFDGLSHALCHLIPTYVASTESLRPASQQRQGQQCAIGGVAVGYRTQALRRRWPLAAMWYPPGAFIYGRSELRPLRTPLGSRRSSLRVPP